MSGSRTVAEDNEAANQMLASFPKKPALTWLCSVPSAPAKNSFRKLSVPLPGVSAAFGLAETVRFRNGVTVSVQLSCAVG